MTPGDARLELGADAIGEMGGDEPVDRLALGRHGAPLGGGNVLGDLREFAAAHVLEAAVAETERADQRPVDDRDRRSGGSGR